MKKTRIVKVALLMVAGAWALDVLWAEQAGNTLANGNREEQSKMTNEKVIMLIEAKIQPERRAELVEVLRAENAIAVLEDINELGTVL